MRRLSTFIFGMVAGGLLVYVALNYHLIHTQDGIHLVPKIESSLAGTYVDVRSFTPGDWLNHSDVAMALVQADQGDLMTSAAGDAIWNGIDQALPQGGANR